MNMQRHFYPISLLILALSLVSLSGCGLLGGSRMDCSEDMLATLKIQAPQSAKTTSESCSSGINPTYRSILAISPADLVALQQATDVTNWETNASKAIAFKDQAASMQSVLFGQFGDGNYIEEVLIDTSNSKQYTVYFERVYVD